MEIYNVEVCQYGGDHEWVATDLDLDDGTWFEVECKKCGLKKTNS